MCGRTPRNQGNGFLISEVGILLLPSKEATKGIRTYDKVLQSGVMKVTHIAIRGTIMNTKLLLLSLLITEIPYLSW